METHLYIFLKTKWIVYFKVPAHSETSKTYCCWPCRSDPLALQLTVPQTGFVPGQSIPLTVLITNDSHIPVEQLLMSFVMLVTYHSKPPSMPNFTCDGSILVAMARPTFILSLPQFWIIHFAKWSIQATNKPCRTGKRPRISWFGGLGVQLLSNSNYYSRPSSLLFLFL